MKDYEEEEMFECDPCLEMRQFEICKNCNEKTYHFVEFEADDNDENMCYQICSKCCSVSDKRYCEYA